MLEKIKIQCRDLIESGKVKLIIGYSEGANGKVHPDFFINKNDIDRMVFDDRCIHNLSVYLMKPEVREIGRPALIANPYVMRSVVQLAKEKQFGNDDIVMIYSDGRVEPLIFEEIKSAVDYLPSFPLEIQPGDMEKIEMLEKMTPEERWKFWINEFSHCIKCYACRASCALCYCPRCTVECNQPQWIHVPSHELGNLEWHIMRAMHLAGRCTMCGECSRACPVDIPLHLLTTKLAIDIEKNFGVRPQENMDDEYVLSTFKPNDSENFMR